MTETDDFMDISPETNLIRSYRATRCDYVLLVGEGVDNAFDVDADRVTIQIDAERVIFQDDGMGITKDRIRALFSLGQHAAAIRGTLGRFGIGIKAQAINAGDVMDILSISIDGSVRAHVNWKDVLREGVWRIPSPRWRPHEVGAPTGTTITISALRQPPTIPSEKIRDELAERFYPAIKAGKKIILNGSPIDEIADPAMTDVVSRSLELSGGRSAELHAGILAHPGKRNGIHVAFLHRTIKPSSSTGCKEYTGAKRLFGRLQLVGPWHLSQFKNDLTDEEEIEELDDAVFEVLQPLLEKINSASMDARLDEIMQRINDLLPVEIAARPRSQRKKQPPPPPPPPPKKRPPGKIDADKADVGKGPAKSKKPDNRLMITWEGDAEDDGIGSFQPGRPHRVNLSKDDPTIASLIKLKDQDVAAHQLRLIALAIYEQGRADPELPLESFGKRIARLLSADQRLREAVG